NYADQSTWTNLGVLKYNSQGSSATTNSQQLTQGDIVQVSQGYDALKGIAGDLYSYKGTNGTPVDLATADYSDQNSWTHIGASKFDTALTEVTTKLQSLSAGSLVKVVEGHASGKGIIGHIYQYVGSSGLPIDLAGSNYTDQS